MASSIALSTASQMRWCRPRSPVDPMYMPGRLRTASRPSRTVMEDALESLFFFAAATGLYVSLPERSVRRARHRSAGPSRTTPHSLLVHPRGKVPDRLLSASQTASRHRTGGPPPGRGSVGVLGADSGRLAVRVARPAAGHVAGTPA